MGFLKFLKKGNKQDIDRSIDDLDVPPAPPSGMQSEPTPADFGKLPDLPELPQMDRQQDPLLDQDSDFSFADKHDDIFDSDPLPPEMPDNEPLPPEGDLAPPPVQTKPEMPKETKEIHTDIAQATNYDPLGEATKEAMHDTAQTLHHERNVSGPIYIKLDRFSHIIYDMNTIRSDLKKSNESFQALVDINEAKDKQYDKWKNSILDLQKKLLFMEQTVFKGGRQ